MADEYEGIGYNPKNYELNYDALSFSYEDQLVFSLGVKDGKVVVSYNESIDPEVAGSEWAKAFWEKFKDELTTLAFKDIT